MALLKWILNIFQGFFPKHHLVSENVNHLNVSLRKHFSKRDENTWYSRCFRRTGPCAQILLHAFFPFGKFWCILAYWEFWEILCKETYFKMTRTFPNLCDHRNLVIEHFILEGKEETDPWQMRCYLTYLPRMAWIGRNIVHHLGEMVSVSGLCNVCINLCHGAQLYFWTFCHKKMESWHYYQGLSITAIPDTSLRNQSLMSAVDLAPSHHPEQDDLNLQVHAQIVSAGPSRNKCISSSSSRAPGRTIIPTMGCSR